MIMTNFASLFFLTSTVWILIIYFVWCYISDHSKHDEHMDNFFMNYNAGREKPDWKKRKWYE